KVRGLLIAAAAFCRKQFRYPGRGPMIALISTLARHLAVVQNNLSRVRLACAALLLGALLIDGQQAFAADYSEAFQDNLAQRWETSGTGSWTLNTYYVSPSGPNEISTYNGATWA